MITQAIGSTRSQLIGRSLIFALGFLMLTLSACGSAVSSKSPVEVQIAVSEFKFDSSLTTFSVGTPYRFVITNKGALAHDWMIMPQGEIDEKKALIMVEDTELLPGTSVTKEFTFTQPGNYEFACHVAGHYEAGMHLNILVK